MDAQIMSAKALQRVFPTTVASYLIFRGWIRQESLSDQSAVTFDLRQRVRLQGRLGRAVGLGDGSYGLADGGYCGAGVMQRYGIAGHELGFGEDGTDISGLGPGHPAALPSGPVDPLAFSETLAATSAPLARFRFLTGGTILDAPVATT